jgi:hypothetical protein
LRKHRVKAHFLTADLVGRVLSTPAAADESVRRGVGFDSTIQQPTPNRDPADRNLENTPGI